jgi:hypothetical protein
MVAVDRCWLKNWKAMDHPLCFAAVSCLEGVSGRNAENWYRLIGWQSSPLRLTLKLPSMRCDGPLFVASG